MSTEQNKSIAIQLLEDISKGNTESVLNALSDNVTWWVGGNIPLFSGKHSKQVMAEIFKNMASLSTTGLNIKVTNIIAEGDFVAVEGNSNAQLPTGNTYQNNYHWLFEIKDGQIQVAKEYMDTQLLKETMDSMMP